LLLIVFARILTNKHTGTFDLNAVKLPDGCT